ncbi:MAG: hypothetical protein OEY09_20065 [Gammaproteobacteria bacterium]|nr:hypothetical protein [Gammaproteobacteria bacterium]
MMKTTKICRRHAGLDPVSTLLNAAPTQPAAPHSIAMMVLIEKWV